jgi:ribonuclease P protein component
VRAQLTRLKNRADFLRTAAARRKAAAPGLVLQVAAQPAEVSAPDRVRIGFTASRKVGNAVARNRARRRLRAAADLVMPRHAEPGRDYVLIARGDTGERPWPLLLADLELALKRVKAWRDQAGEAA